MTPLLRREARKRAAELEVEKLKLEARSLHQEWPDGMTKDQIMEKPNLAP